MLLNNEYRTHYCGKLDTTNVGEEVKLSGGCTLSEIMEDLYLLT